MITLHMVLLYGANKGVQFIAKVAFWLESFGIDVPRGISVKGICAGQQQGFIRYRASLVYNLFSRSMWSCKGEDGAISVKFLYESSDIR
jgi:hypothetical protein